MSSKPTVPPSDKTAAKKAAVLGSGKKNLARPLAFGLTLLFFVAGSYLFLGKGPEAGPAVADEPPAAASGEISFPVSDFADGQARFHKLDGGGGVSVRYYGVRAKDGTVRTAYDACDACWPEGKGYRQNGDVMVCLNCRRVFEISKIGEAHGGCNPAPLKSRVEGDKLVIAVKDILAGRRYFDLPKGN